tara:strand:- start:441 stop:1829 length:1389 start_codon:yes stop_codon:yes gene_type:complete
MNMDKSKIKEYFEKGILVNKEMLASMQNGQILEPPIDKKIEQPINGKYEIALSYTNEPKKYTVKDFTNVFVSRFKFFERLLRMRNELHSLSSINKIKSKKERENQSVIGIISEIKQTRSGSYIITIEDLTDELKVIVSKKNKQLIAQAMDLVPDEIIGVVGTTADNAFFASQFVWPDIPHKELKTLDEEMYAIFLSDIHVGSKYFLSEAFDKFLEWINGNVGDDKQKNIASKVKYLFIIGDVVDGVGIYPSQEKELTLTNISEQYDEVARLLKKIPERIKITICPGNHDAVHLAEPQPIFDKKFAAAMYTLPNVELVSNPAMITICKSGQFSGFNILMYHGYSFDYYVANVNSLRTGGGYHRGDLIMKYLLKRRHLAPCFNSTPYLPSHKEDPLIIQTIPDFFVTGHIHYAVAGNYKNTTLISCSCWQEMTTFQEKLGHNPEPARVPVVNLQTREVKMLKFI